MSAIRIASATAVCLLLVASTVVAGPSPFFMGLGDLPGWTYSNLPLGVSADGTTVVGGILSATGSQAFRWSQSTGMVGLGDLPGGRVFSRATGVSADGSVVVGTGEDSSGTVAFRWQNATMTALAKPSGMVSTYAAAVSANGRLTVGWGQSLTTSEACRWDDDAVTGLGDLPGGAVNSSAVAVSADGGVIIGAGTTGDTAQNTAFRWEAGIMQDLMLQSPRAISPDGAVIVGGNGSGDVGYRREGGVLTHLGTLPGYKPGCSPRGVSEFGRVVVGGSTGKAFIWDAQHGMRSLQDILSSLGLNLTGWHLSSAEAITPDGLTIVGYGYDAAGSAEAWIARVPEPATLGLLGLGVVFVRRRR